MRTLLAVLLILVAAVPGSAAPPVLPSADETPLWVTYRNEKVPFSLAVPASHFYAEPQAPAGDGATFVALDGQATISAWSNYNVLDQDLAALLQDALARHAADRVTYRKEGSGWFVLSGYSGQDIFYEKALVDEGAIYELRVQYPTAQRSLYDDLVAVVANSFRAGE